jgi:orotate phosphoribosyltransferase
MSIENKVAQLLLQINAIKLSPQKPFTWASGLKAPIYCDNRIVLSHPAVRKQIVSFFLQKSESFPTFDMVAGVATAGIAHGVLLADALDQPFAYVRAKAKSHGRQNLIEGEVQGHERILVVEDLISTGGSSLAAVEALRETGAEVVGTIAIFTYGFEQARAAFANANCPLETLTNYPTLLSEAISARYIEAADLETLQSWREDAKLWSAQFKSD